MSLMNETLIIRQPDDPPGSGNPSQSPALQVQTEDGGGNYFKITGGHGDAEISGSVQAGVRGFKLPGGISWTAGTSDPIGSPAHGSLYTNNATGQLFVYESGGWVGK